MEIDKDTLTKVIEAILNSSQTFQRELLLYQLIFQTFCEREGLNDEMRQQIVDRARELSATRIAGVAEAAHKELLAKVPQIIELLDSNQDEALRLLKEWKPTGAPN